MNNANDPPEHIRDAMERLATSSAALRNTEAVLATITRNAVELIREVDVADVMLVDDGRFRSIAPTKSSLPSSTRCSTSCRKGRA